MNLASVLILLAVIAAAVLALRVFLKSGGRGKGCGCGCAGCQTQEIAQRLIISPLTVNRHRENIKAKTGMRTLAQLTSWFQSIKNQ